MILDGTVLLERIELLESKLEEDAERGGEPVGKVKWRARWTLDQMRDAVRQAEEPWVSTSRVVLERGWDPQTLRRHARDKLAGRALPKAWAGLQVQRKGRHAFQFLLSSIPSKDE